jgi:hypothetical protein
VPSNQNVWAFNGTTFSPAVAIDPEHSGPRAVSCPSTSFCGAIDDRAVVTYNGVSWSTPIALLPEPVGFDAQYEEFHSISCTSATFCAAAYENATGDGWAAGGVYVYNGGLWTSSVVTNADVRSISCLGSAFCVAVGGNGTPSGTGPYLAAVYRNGSWSTDFPFDERPDAVSCRTSTSCVAVAGSVYYTFDGQAWTSSMPLPLDASTVSCTPTYCLALSTDGRSSRYGGTSWSSPAATGTPSVTGTSLSCPSATFCAAPNMNNGISRYNGTTWTQSATGDTGSLTGIGSASSTFCVVVDSAGRAIFGY